MGRYEVPPPAEMWDSPRGNQLFDALHLSLIALAYADTGASTPHFAAASVDHPPSAVGTIETTWTRSEPWPKFLRQPCPTTINTLTVNAGYHQLVDGTLVKLRIEPTDGSRPSETITLGEDGLVMITTPTSRGEGSLGMSLTPQAMYAVLSAIANSSPN